MDKHFKTVSYTGSNIIIVCNLPLRPPLTVILPEPKVSVFNAYLANTESD